MELTREHFRAMFYYDFRRGLPQEECIAQLTTTFTFDDVEVPSPATLRNWFKEFEETHQIRSNIKSAVPPSDVEPTPGTEMLITTASIHKHLAKKESSGKVISRSRKSKPKKIEIPII